MKESLSHRRLAENEIIFRKRNEDVQRGIEEVKKVAEQEGQDDLIPEIDIPLHFYCECSDENCRKRIKLRPSEYSKLHKNSKYFVILPGHEVPEIEDVIDKTTSYYVVKKHVQPPKQAQKLHSTDVDNI